MNQTKTACELLEILGGGDIVLIREVYLHADQVLATRWWPGRLFCGTQAYGRVSAAIRVADDLLLRCNLTRHSA